MTAVIELPNETAQSSAATSAAEVRVHPGTAIDAWVADRAAMSAVDHPARTYRWLQIVRDGLGHQPLVVEGISEGITVGVLPLALVQSQLFGRFLVSLPYVNSAGLIANNDGVAQRLIDRAVELADEHNVRYLELRQELEVQHAAL